MPDSSNIFDFEAAKNLPQLIRFGTSSWTYPGWQGQVYNQEYKNEKLFKTTCLKEYSAFPWFRTVGIDSSFYSPPTKETLESYAKQVPEDFKWLSKVWEEITIPVYPKHKRYGNKAGQSNNNFLNPNLFTDRVLAPYSEQSLAKHAGPFVFEFQMFSKEQATNSNWFLTRLDAFLSRLPKEFLYACEIRSPQLLHSDYFSILNSNNVTHCFNHWTYMPALHEQMKAAAQQGGLTAPFFVARILTPRGITYEKAVERFKPYAQLQNVITEMREDVKRIARRALQRNIPAFIVINNRSEGNAPQTINAIGSELVNDLQALTKR